MSKISYNKKRVMDKPRAEKGGIFIPLMGMLLLSAVLLSIRLVHAGEETRTIAAVGTAIIYKADIETAKQQAIANGLVTAVDKAVSDLLNNELLSSNFRIINQIIYNNPDKYISDYKVLTQDITDKDYRVLVQAKVLIKKLENRLAKSGVMQVRRVKLKSIEMIVQGTRNLSHFINFRKGLKEIPGVKEMRVSDMQPDEAKLVVDFRGSTKELTEALILKKFDAFSIRIFEISDDTLRIELI